jgi:hypothetical protein
MRGRGASLPREWRYLDYGMIIGTALVIAGVLLMAISPSSPLPMYFVRA